MNLRLSRVVLPLAAFSLELDLTLTTRATAICGPSGAGKTSLLDLIAGLRRPLSGSIQLNETVFDSTEPRVHLPARKRRIGYVPQDLALFPHMTVRRNLLYGCRSRDHTAPVTSWYDVVQVAKVLEIEPLMERGVDKLSGGEKQRVALARAVLSAPRLLLLDEPLSSLDVSLKQRILPYLVAVRDEFQVPMIYVTHDLDDARNLCDRVIFIENGRVIDTRLDPPTSPEAAD